MVKAIANLKKPKATAVQALTADDRRHLAEFDERREILRLRVEAVAKRAQNGLVVYGPPGLGKTTTTRKTLAKLRCKPIERNGNVTPRGLFEVMRDFPNRVIVLDDLHQLLHHQVAMQILLAALDGEIGQSRPITYTKHGSEADGDCVDFSGGIIAISNLTIPDTPMGAALVSRVRCFDFTPTPEQLAAAIRDYSNQGFTCATGVMAPAECRQVVDFVLEQAAALKRDAGVDVRVDFRTVHHAYADYLQRNGKKGIQWQRLVLDHLRSAPRPQVTAPTTKKGRLELERIQLLKAKAENDRLPKSEQLKFPDICKQFGISTSKGYELINPK